MAGSFSTICCQIHLILLTPALIAIRVSWHTRFGG